MPPISAPLPTGTTTAAGGSGSWSRISSAIDAVALELRRLDAVLEERNVRLGGETLALVLGEVEVGADQPDLGAEPVDQGELRERRAGRRVDHRAQAQPLARPGDGRAVVAGRGRDDGAAPRAPCTPRRSAALRAT